MNDSQELRHILVIEDQKSRRVNTLKETTYSIGRDIGCTLILYDRQVSRQHATLLRVIDYQENSYYYRIIDGNLQGKKSTNGILVNGKYCLSHDLKHGDIIRFGTHSKASYHIVHNNQELELIKMGETIERLPVSPVLVPPDSTEETTIYSENKDSALIESVLASSFQEEVEDAKVTIIVERDEREKVDHTTLQEVSPSSELSADAIIEVNYNGDITYVNPVANLKFSNLNLDHPILSNIIGDPKNIQGNSIVRDINFGNEYYKQYIHYIPQKSLIRSYIIDQTYYKQLENQINNLKNRYKYILGETLEGILWLDEQSKNIMEVNKAYCEIIGYTEAELLNMTIYNLMAMEASIIDSDLLQVARQKPYYLGEVVHIAKNGSMITLQMKVSLTKFNGNNAFCCVVNDLSERKKSEEKLEYQEFHDPLTNLGNRKLLQKQLALAIAQAQKQPTLMAVVFLDLDSFKHINTSFGHTLGDKLLQQFAKRLLSCVRTDDKVARWGGDEFVILLPEIRNKEDTMQLGNRIFQALKKPFYIQTQEIRLKMSMGIALYPQDGEYAETLLKNADAALYRTKQQGRNHYQFYNSNMSSEATLVFKLENHLHRAIENEEFLLDYQPQFNIKNQKITGMEAFLRWNHPEFGLLNAQKFMKLAEKTDLIIKIGKWILKTACNQNMAWQKAGLKPLVVTVNICLKEFHQANFSQVVTEVLDETGLDAEWLELEITEKMLRQNLTLAYKTIRDLHQLGVRLALDDFGTGNSSLGYLKQFSFQTLKLDRTFIRDLSGSAQEKAIIAAAIAMGEGFNLRVVAEGVETKKQLDLLNQLECQEAQGNILSPTLSKINATKFLTETLQKTEN